MGTFQGHALPGAFFATFALWWISQIPRRALLCERAGTPYYTTVTYPCFCLRWPAESVVKLVVTGLGIVLELLASTEYGSAGRIVYWGDIQHVTMYLTFFIASVVEILRYRKCVSVPPGSEYLVNALAFAVEFLLFRFHLHGRKPLDVLIHTLLLYAVAPCAICILLEMKYRDSLLASFGRAFFTLLQGTWFFQVGFILYPPSPHLRHWEHADPDQMTLATMMFAWHAAADFLVCLAVYAGMSRVYGRRCCGGLGRCGGRVGKRLGYELMDYGDAEFEGHLRETMLRQRAVTAAADDSESEV